MNAQHAYLVTIDAATPGDADTIIRRIASHPGVGWSALGTVVPEGR